MRAFVIKMESFFKLKSNTNLQNAEIHFSENKQKLIIPLYQREFKWTNEKVQTLINDISNRSKFIGNIILDELEDRYEIVDGQQRITTLYISLLCLYNYYNNQSLEQKSLLNLIKTSTNSFLLENESIGNYISIKDSGIEILINEKNDFYFQKNDFLRVFNQITTLLNSFESQSKVRDFKRKLLDCEILVLINDTHANVNPVEQIFLDINEKAQLLEVEDIFKGRCFEIFDTDYRQDLKALWISLKKQSANFTQYLGYEDLSQYLYHYLLSTIDNNTSEKLFINNQHYLQDKTMDDTNIILNDMIVYGQNISHLIAQLNLIEYNFSDMCKNSYEYRNTSDHVYIKTMLTEILCVKKPHYQKFPLLNFCNKLLSDASINSNISHKDFRKIITNLYIYGSIFIYVNMTKNKSCIDYTIKEALNSTDDKIKKAVTNSKELRCSMVNKFSFPNGYGFPFLSFIYSVIDFYDSNENWLPKKYMEHDQHTPSTLEHFIIPYKKSKDIAWETISGKCQIIKLKSSNLNNNKKHLLNYLIMDKDLNGALKNYDIVKKITLIKDWYNANGRIMPIHFTLFIKEIEALPSYQKLIEYKKSTLENDLISIAYHDFLNDYFSDENKEKISQSIKQKFQDSFKNT